MLTYLLNIAFAIAATVLYIKAPWTYSYDYCVLLMSLFIAQNVLFFATNKRTHWLGFEFFFALSFFLVNFVYPVFYAPTERIYWSLFSLPFNDDYVTRCTALAYLGMRGICLVRRVFYNSNAKNRQSRHLLYQCVNIYGFSALPS